MKKVGIVASYKQENIDRINRVAFEYITSIEDAGGIPYIIPCNTKNLQPYIDNMDLFIFPGGADIDPSLYSEENQGSKYIVPTNDLFLLKFLSGVIRSNKKILGICKGMQLINIFFGGTLVQELKNAPEHDQYAKQYETIDSIIILPGSFLEKAFGKGELHINSLHHQAINKIGSGLEVVARSKYDNTIEAIEHSTFPIYGVQWHPECLVNHLPLFQWFIRS